jgi:site-specific recombinase XerC
VCERGYFVSDPLKNLRGFDTTPQTQRRAITADEVHRLLDVCPTYRRVLWETALLSGLRANELRHLSVDHLDVERGGLRLDASWTKNRRDDFLPLPHSFVHRLHTFAATGEAIRKYQQAYFGEEIPSRVPASPLLYVPRDPARELDKDLKAATIPKYTREGKVDLHALRLAYINFVIESGASAKEAQTLARHATPAMTMNVYGRTRNERLVQTVERVGEMISAEEKRAGSVPERSDSIAGHEGYAQVFQEGETGKEFMPKGGFEPPRPVRHHPLKMACLPCSTTSAQTLPNTTRSCSRLSIKRLAAVLGYCQWLSQPPSRGKASALFLPFCRLWLLSRLHRRWGSLCRWSGLCHRSLAGNRRAFTGMRGHIGQP